MLEVRAAGEGDEDWLNALLSEPFDEEFAHLPAVQRELLVEMQTTAKHRDYRRQWPAAETLILRFGASRVGYLMLSEEPGALHLVDILIARGERGAGIGSEALRWLQLRAEQAGKPIELSVMGVNPARRLYQRLGFAEGPESGPYLRMIWSP